MRAFRNGRVILAVIATLGALCVASDAQDAAVGNHESTVTFSVPDYAEHGQDWPIEVQQLLVNGEPVPLGAPVHVKGNWLDHITLVVKNTSTRDIVKGGMNIILPETGNGTSAHPYQTVPDNLGVIPDWVLYRPDGSKMSIDPRAPVVEPIDVAPGETIRFSISLSNIDPAQFMDQMYAAAGGAITLVKIQFFPFYFSDQTAWIAEHYQQFSAPNVKPGERHLITADEFFKRSSSTHL